MTDETKLKVEQLCAVLDIDAETYAKVTPVITALEEISKLFPTLETYEKRMIFLTLRIMEQHIRRDQISIDHAQTSQIMNKVLRHES